MQLKLRLRRFWNPDLSSNRFSRTKEKASVKFYKKTGKKFIFNFLQQHTKRILRRCWCLRRLRTKNKSTMSIFSESLRVNITVKERARREKKISEREWKRRERGKVREFVIILFYVFCMQSSIIFFFLITSSDIILNNKKKILKYDFLISRGKILLLNLISIVTDYLSFSTTEFNNFIK